MNGLLAPAYPMVRYGPFLYLPLAAPTFLPDTPIEIVCPITSRCTGDVRARVKLYIYEGSVWPGHGTKLKDYTSPEQAMSPDQTANFTFSHTTVKGTIDRRDVGIEVQYWDGSKWVVDGSWEGDDIYFVRAIEYAFEIGAPSVRAV